MSVRELFRPVNNGVEGIIVIMSRNVYISSSFLSLFCCVGVQSGCPEADPSTTHFREPPQHSDICKCAMEVLSLAGDN